MFKLRDRLKTSLIKLDFSRFSKKTSGQMKIWEKPRRLVKPTELNAVHNTTFNWTFISVHFLQSQIFEASAIIAFTWAHIEFIQKCPQNKHELTIHNDNETSHPPPHLVPSKSRLWQSQTQINYIVRVDDGHSRSTLTDM